MSRHRLSPLLDPKSVVTYDAASLSGTTRPARADLALTALPLSALAPVVEACAEAGTRFLVLTALDPEAGTPEGRTAQARLLAQARARGVRLLGPHCTALMRPASGFSIGGGPEAVKAGRVALLSQSGAVITALLDWAAPAGIGFSSVVALGGALDLDFGELLDWYLFDAQTDSVLLFLEGVRDARGFMSNVRAVSRVKPVVIMKAGRHESPHRGGGATHSDALTGNDRVFDAAIARAGAVRAHTTFQFLAAARLLALRKRPGGPRLGIVTNGGGPGVIAADAVPGNDLELAALVETAGDQIESTLRRVLADPRVDAALGIFVPRTGLSLDDAAQAIVRANTGQPKVVAAVLAGGATAAPGQRRLDAAGIPQFLSPENAVDALGLLQRFAVNQQKLRQAPVAIDEGFAPDLAAAEALYRAVRAQGRTLLDEVESKTLLGHFGLNAPPSIVAGDPQAAAAAACRLGFPVVLKVLSPDVLHKSDVGGVRINLQSATAVQAAAEDILESVARIRPGARVTGLVVQPMVRTRHQRELYLGMATDPMFGAVIAFGAGGVAVEQIDDVAIGLPPLNPLLARALIQRTRVARLLRPYRSVPGIDFPQLEQTLVRFSALVCACPWIESLDINPLVVDEGRVTALDARIVLRGEHSPAPPHWSGAYGHLAIHPYPRELEEWVTLRNQQRVLLRAIRPEDADLERAFVARLSPQTLYRRFMMPVKELSDAMIERFTQIDYDRELALIAVEEGPEGAMLGVARIIPTWEEGVAEFAIVVGDWMQHTGLGQALMLRLFNAARARGYTAIEGVVLGENISMQRFCERLGFSLRLNPDDPAERLARRTL